MNGKSYKSDLIVFTDKIKAGWWRKEGHQLQKEDLKEVLEAKPEVLVVGTSYYGKMAVLHETRRHVESEGIELIVKKTAEACKNFNRLIESKRVVRALYLAC